MASYQTRQKKLLTEFLSKHDEKQFTVEELSEELSRTLGDRAPGTSTIYRLINKMVNNGEVKRVLEENSRHVRYQIKAGGECLYHLHLKCTGCGKLLHMNSRQSSEILEKIEGENEFCVNREQSTLFGCCRGCMENMPLKEKEI